MSKHRVYWALGLSLALNLFLGGFLVARGMKAERYGRAEGSRGGGPFKVWEVIKHSKNPELRQRLRGELKRMRPERQALRQARRQVKLSLESEPFQAERLSSSLAQLRSATHNSQGQLHALMVEVAKELSPAERREMAKKNWSRSRRAAKKSRPAEDLPANKR